MNEVMGMSQPGVGRERVVTEAFVSLADTLVDDYDVIELLTRLVGHSVALVGADAGAIMLADPQGRLRAVAASSEDAQLSELMQLQADEGPCVQCYHQVAPVTVTDLRTAGSRWPVFVAAVTGTSVFRAVHAVPLRLRGQAIGALNWFHHQPGAMNAEDLVLGQALADVATIAILQERALRRAEVLSEQLRAALHSRVVIEQAKGVLAQHGGLPMDEAFTALRRHARHHRTRLADLAHAIAQGTLDPATVLADPTKQP
jgi:GAF domain-containing protein